jgi:hypothetical protein
VGSTRSCDGFALIVHVVLALFTTWSGIAANDSRRSGQASPRNRSMIETSSGGVSCMG